MCIIVYLYGKIKRMHVASIKYCVNKLFRVCVCVHMRMCACMGVCGCVCVPMTCSSLLGRSTMGLPSAVVSSFVRRSSKAFTMVLRRFTLPLEESICFFQTLYSSKGLKRRNLG